MPSSQYGHHHRVPVLLLKTKSTPTDSYEELLSSSRGDLNFAPQFIPVLLHKFQDEGISKLQELLKEKRIGKSENSAFGGLIFTSQRAVEAFTQVVQDGKGDYNWPHLQYVPIYSVGPATTRALKAIPQNPALQIFGSHTGNGEALAHFILDHYGKWHTKRPNLPPILFLVGEQRRDIIARTLMDLNLPVASRIEVTEEVVYETGVMESFSEDFDEALKATAHVQSRWVVVFSPTGCDSMLRGLGMLDPKTGKALRDNRDGKTFVATIGPTTWEHLVSTFDFEPDVCAETPSPEGVLRGILDYESRRKSPHS